MPVFDYNPNEVTVGFPVFPKGDYEFEVGEPKPYHTAGDGDEKKEQAGVAYVLKCVTDGAMKGKIFYQRCGIIDDNQRSGTKRFQMAVLGYKTGEAEEIRFNEDTRNLDWKIDVDAKTCGDGWHQLKGKVVSASMEPTIAKKGPNVGEQQNGFPQFRAFGV